MKLILVVHVSMCTGFILLNVLLIVDRVKTFENYCSVVSHSQFTFHTFGILFLYFIVEFALLKKKRWGEGEGRNFAGLYNPKEDRLCV